MNIRNAFFHGFSVGQRQWRVAAIVYFIQLCLAIILGMQVFNVLEASIGNSLEINKLLKNYDHTVISDFLKIHGASITPLIGQLRWLLLVWLFFSVFIDAGLLVSASLNDQSRSLSEAETFWQGGAIYFFPFLKISLIFLLLAVVWTAVIWLPVATFFEPSLEYFSSEKYSVWVVIFLLFIFLVGLAVLFIWSVLSRLNKIKTNGSLLFCLKNGWQIFRKNKWQFWVLMSSFVVLQLILVAVYWMLDAFGGMKTPLLILAYFIVQQAFIFFRIQIRQMMYAGIGCLNQ